MIDGAQIVIIFELSMMIAGAIHHTLIWSTDNGLQI